MFHFSSLSSKDCFAPTHKVSFFFTFQLAKAIKKERWIVSVSTWLGFHPSSTGCSLLVAVKSRVFHTMSAASHEQGVSSVWETHQENYLISPNCSQTRASSQWGIAIWTETNRMPMPMGGMAMGPDLPQGTAADDQWEIQASRHWWQRVHGQLDWPSIGTPPSRYFTWHR